MSERIKKLRKILNLTQQEFANRLGTTRNNIAGYEIGRRIPSVAVISLICREFNVNETWLRTGEGEMFDGRSVDDELDQVFSAIAVSDDELIKRIICAYWKLDDREKAAVKKLIDGFSSPTDSPAPEPAPQELDIEAQVELYRQQLLLEQERESQASSVNGSAAG